jgi:outer membrane protein assembly factor BamB
VPGWPSGPFSPVGCEAGASGCPGFTDGAGRGWLASSVVPRRLAALDVPATIAAGVVVSAGDGQVRASSIDGARLWTWSGEGRILGGSESSVVLLTGANVLVGLDASTGSVRFSFPLESDEKDTAAWQPGQYRIAGGYLAMERLRPDAPDDPESPVYYLTLDTVIIAALD